MRGNNESGPLKMNKLNRVPTNLVKRKLFPLSAFENEKKKKKRNTMSRLNNTNVNKSWIIYLSGVE